MKKYRKKPIEIEAVRFRDSPSSIEEICKWGGDKIKIDLQYGMSLNIKTLEGMMTARPGDWIIKGVKGEFYPCKPDIFEATYEEVV